MTTRTLKYRGCKSEMTSLLIVLLHSMRYKMSYSRIHTLLDIAVKWKSEDFNQFQRNWNDEFVKCAKDKFGLTVNNTLCITDRKILIVLLYIENVKLCSIVVEWKKNDYTLRVSMEDDARWIFYFAKILFKLAYDFKNILKPIEINGQELKIGEWLAATLFELCGDRAGMFATLDEAEDRK